MPPPTTGETSSDVYIETPFIAQQAYQCGPASLAMMLRWNQLPADVEQLVSEVWLPKRKGTLAMELAAAGRARGLLAYPVTTPDALFVELQAGHPVLIMQNLQLVHWPQWHFAVVIGYRDGGQKMLLHSGTMRLKTSYWNRFIRTWARADYWGMVLLPATDLPASATPDGLFKALTAMQAATALPLWRAARSRFPDNGQLGFGYANALWAQGQHKKALSEFEEAVQLTPTLVPAWNNLAYARKAAGDEAGALRAICHAHHLAPDDAAITNSLADIAEDNACDRAEN